MNHNSDQMFHAAKIMPIILFNCCSILTMVLITYDNKVSKFCLIPFYWILIFKSLHCRNWYTSLFRTDPKIQHIKISITQTPRRSFHTENGAHYIELFQLRVYKIQCSWKLLMRSSNLIWKINICYCFWVCIKDLKRQESCFSWFIIFVKKCWFIFDLPKEKKHPNKSCFFLWDWQLQIASAFLLK